MKKIALIVFIPFSLMATGDFLQIEKGSICKDMFENPATMGLSDFSFFFFHKLLYCDMGYLTINAVIPFKDYTFGYGLRYLDYGKIEETTHNDKQGTGRLYSSDSLAASIACAISSRKNLIFGGGINFIQECIDDVKASGGSLDFGFVWNPEVAKWLFLGGAIKNITLKKLSFIKEEEPLSKELGIGFGIKKEPVEFNLDIFAPKEEKVDFLIQAEWLIQDFLIPSFGYRSDIYIGGFDFGISFIVDKYRIKYSYFPTSISDSHSILFGIEIKKGIRKMDIY